MPLEGVTVIEMAVMFAAPFGATLLADLGARVIKIEPLAGDPIRSIMPFPESGGAKVMQGKESICVDITTPENVNAVFAKVKDQWGRLDVLFNNAGMGAPAVPMEELPVETWRAVVDINLNAMFYCTQAAIRIMKAQDPKGGRIKALAIGGPQRSPLLPEVSTFTELGYPEVETHAWFGFFLPARSPAEAVQRLYADTRKILDDPEFRQKQLIDKGYDVVGSSPTEFAAYIKRDSQSRARAVKISGAKAE